MFPGLPLIIFIVTLPAFANAQVYKWTDENGVVHYGDERPNVSHQQFQFKGYSEIQMQDNIRAREAIAGQQRRPSRPPARQNAAGEHYQDLAEHQEAQRKRAMCQSYRERIKWIDSRLRAGGYSVGLGNRLRAERRELHGKLAWECIRG